MRCPIGRTFAGRALSLTGAFLFASSAYAEPGEAEDAKTRQQLQRTLVTSGSDPIDAFAIWRSEDDPSRFIKPVIMLSASIVTYLPSSNVDEDLAPRISTLALARFGLEGRPFPFLTFRSVFERNLGYSLARNGPVGTSVWEGTSSLQARENYIRLRYSGFDLTAGILRDPATVDFVSDNVLDSFGMDPFVRDPLLLSGFSQGQGAMLRYAHALNEGMTLTGGLSFTGGNPLTTSLAFGFGGDVSSLGTLFTAPLRAIANGVPGSDIHLLTITPSLTFESRPVAVRLAFQYYDVDPDATNGQDARLSGWNARATAESNLPLGLRVFGTFAIRRNEQLAIPDVTVKKEESFEGLLFGAGIDYTAGAFSAGGVYYWHNSDLGSGNDLTLQYINVGLTYWLQSQHVAAGLRWARSMAGRDGEPEPILKATDNFILSLRLLI